VESDEDPDSSKLEQYLQDVHAQLSALAAGDCAEIKISHNDMVAFRQAADRLSPENWKRFSDQVVAVVQEACTAIKANPTLKPIAAISITKPGIFGGGRADMGGHV
jgi:hypothetical protein